MPGTYADDAELDLGDARAGHERDVGRGVEAWSAGVPAWASPLDSAIEKHDECAAAMSSSGLVLPFGSSAREGQFTS